MTHQNKLSVTVIAAGLMAPLPSEAQATAAAQAHYPRNTVDDETRRVSRREPRRQMGGFHRLGTFAFSTKREGDDIEQIYILNLAQGGEARHWRAVATVMEHFSRTLSFTPGRRTLRE